MGMNILIRDPNPARGNKLLKRKEDGRDVAHIPVQNRLIFGPFTIQGAQGVRRMRHALNHGVRGAPWGMCVVPEGETP